MPIFAGIVASAFGYVFSILAARMTAGAAFALAVAAVLTAAIVALKAAMAGIWAMLPLVAPQVVIDGMSLILPSNIGTFFTAIILTDVIATAYQFWREVAGLVVLAAKP